MINNINLNKPNYKLFQKPTPSFKANGRAYLTPDGLCMGCITWMFRNDLEWKKLAKYEITHFSDKPKVNIVILGCSDGSEAYTKAISLFEAFGEEEREKAQKFFPIIAYDLDQDILKAANSSLINTGVVDRMNLQMNCENYEDYFSPTNENLEVANDIVMKLKRKQTLKVKRILTDNIRFRQGEMFQKLSELNDNGNTILMCRNVLGYLENHEIENFVKLASFRLKKGSLFVIGDHDTNISNIRDSLKKYGFEPVMKNVYKKT